MGGVDETSMSNTCRKHNISLGRKWVTLEQSFKEALSMSHQRKARVLMQSHSKHMQNPWQCLKYSFTYPNCVFRMVSEYKVRATNWWVNVNHKITRSPMFCLMSTNQRAGDGQGGLACCDSQGRKESDTTERLNWTRETNSILLRSGIFKKWHKGTSLQDRNRLGLP